MSVCLCVVRTINNDKQTDAEFLTVLLKPYEGHYLVYNSLNTTDART